MHSMLIENRHKRVEELEKRLKSMEESLKRATAKLQQPQSREEDTTALVRKEPPVQILPDEVGSPSFLDQLSEGFPMDLAVNIPWDGPLPLGLDINYSNGKALFETPLTRTDHIRPSDHGR